MRLDIVLPENILAVVLVVVRVLPGHGYGFILKSVIM